MSDEVVLCRDCKWFRRRSYMNDERVWCQTDHGWCHLAPPIPLGNISCFPEVLENDYCSKAERKTKEKGEKEA